MRIKENYRLKQVADTWIVLPLAEEMLSFNGIIRLNETGVFLWKQLEAGADLEKMAKALTLEYNVTIEQARKDSLAFCKKVIAAGCIEE